MKNKTNKYVVYWMRRDLRLDDNHALHQALKSGLPVQPIFIFDQDILSKLPADDARVTFLHRELAEIKKKLQEEYRSDLKVYTGRPVDIYTQLFSDEQVNAVYFNHDYEPYARERDQEVCSLGESRGVEVYSFKDHVIFEKDEVTKADGGAYTVFTPYKKRWLSRMADEGIPTFDCQANSSNFKEVTHIEPMISLEKIGFKESKVTFPSSEVSQRVIREYDKTRNFPSLQDGTSRLGVHFRFGTISIRDKARKAAELNEVYLSELIWRDFYAQILWNFPHVATSAFREKYEMIPWRDAPEDFERWYTGTTGYPIVDAGMRELNATGYMHNRVRMITASFLTKHLLIDWRWGEAYFAEKLLDFDLASNNGGWQWASGSGTDAAPYFRIFNPTSQLEKFDKDLRYVRRWIPEYGTSDYPVPMVDHKAARERCLHTYKEALNG